MVTTACPTGRQASRASERAGSSSENTSSSSRIGALPISLGDQLVAGQAQGQGQRPLLALGAVGPARQAADLEDQLVSVGSDRGDPPAQVVAAA